MHVCLINPPGIQPKSWGRKPHVLQPIGIAYVAAMLEKQHKTSIIDAFIEGRKNIEDIDMTKYRVGLKRSELAHKIKTASPDIVAINIPSFGWSRTAFEVASIAKNIDKNIVTAVDGLYPSAKPLDCIENPCIDFAVIGEPEYTMLELVNALESSNVDALEKIRGLAFKKNEKMTVNPRRPAIKDLDLLPFPARHLLPMKEYFSAVKEYPLRGEINKPWASMITSRGCPYNCIFCTTHIVMGKKWRGRSPENVIKEIEELVYKHNIKHIDFTDENMTLDRKRMEAICDLIIKNRLDIKWYTPNGVRADTLDEALLKKMAKAGCQRIYIAPESGVQRVVDKIIKKELSLKKVEEVVFLCKKIGIKVSCFFIIGLIGETKKDIKATIKYAYKLRQLGADRFYFSFATPIYGTKLYQQAKQYGLLKEKIRDEDLAAAQPIIETPEFTIEDLRKLCAQANLVNKKLTFDKIIRGLRNPKNMIDFLLKN